MHPILFQIGYLTVYSYGVCIALAFLVCSYLAAGQASRYGIEKAYIYDLSVWLVVSGLIGARLTYAALNFNYYRDNLLEIFFIWQGGLIYYGGLAGALCGSLWYIKKRARISYLVVADIIAPYIALGQSIGRIGCFMNGCCYGRLGHPAQLYESFATLMIFVALKKVQGARCKVQGYVFFLYLLLYSMARFWLEYLRGDNPAILFNLTLSQFISIAVSFSSIYALARIHCNR